MPRTDHSRKTLQNGKCHPCRDGRELLPADQSVEPDAKTEPTARTARGAHGTTQVNQKGMILLKGTERTGTKVQPPPVLSR